MFTQQAVESAAEGLRHARRVHDDRRQHLRPLSARHDLSLRSADIAAALGAPHPPLLPLRMSEVAAPSRTGLWLLVLVAG